MTPRQRADELVARIKQQPTMWMPELSLEIEKAVQAAVEEEREACAKIAREEAGRIKRASGFHFSTCRESQAAHGTATGIEEEIRARSEKNGQA